jgi:hypothetical protein
MGWSCGALFHWYQHEQVAHGLADDEDYTVYARRCRFCGKIKTADLPMIRGRLKNRIGDPRPIVAVPELFIRTGVLDA